MRYPIRGLGRLSAATLPKGCAGWNCHQLAPRVSDPADIHGGNAVAEGRHSEVHDALSVRTYGNPSPENLVGGFFLAWAYLKSDSIIVPVVLHGLGNLAALAGQVATWYWLRGWHLST